MGNTELDRFGGALGDAGPRAEPPLPIERGGPAGDRSASDLAGAFRAAARVGGGLGIAVGVAVLAGWGLGVPGLARLGAPRAAMAPNTAMALAALGSALLLLGGARDRRQSVRVAIAAGVAVSALGFATLVEYLLGVDFGIDRLIARDALRLVVTKAPGRMAEVTASCLGALGAGLALTAAGRAKRLAQALALAAFAASLVVSAGFLYDIRAVDAVPFLRGIALPTTLTLSVVALGLLLLQAEAGVTRLLASTTAGGLMVRRILPAAVLLPLLLGWLRVLSADRWQLDANLGTALLVVATVLLLSGAIVWQGAALDRTDRERRRVVEAALQAGRYARRLLEASLDPLVTISPGGKITDANLAAENATGRSREELVGTDFSDYFAEPERARAGYLQVFRDGFVQDYPLEIRRRDGRLTPVLYNASVYHAEDGQVAGVFAAARDVTARKLAEDRLTRVNAILKSIRDVNQLIVKEKDRQRLVERACADLVGGGGCRGAWIALFGGASAVSFASAGLESEESAFRARFEGGDLPECAARALASPGVHRVGSPAAECGDCPLTVAYGGRTGLTVRLESAGVTLGVLGASVTAGFAEDDEERGLLAEVAADIAFALRAIDLEGQHRQAVEALRIAGVYNRNLLETSLDPLVTISPEGKVTDVNRATERATGLPRERLIGTDFSDYFTEPSASTR